MKKSALFLLAAVVAVSTVFLMGCSDGGGDSGGGNDNAKLVGTWTRGSDAITFASNGSFILSPDGEAPVNGSSYEFKNNTLTFGGLGSATAVLSNSDQTLTISGSPEGELDGAWTKSS
ncbi:hypothetical protein FACS1894147_10320 [Spirochaetia bacterium]|nr:hypothetical protein FACS1894147_10320 [Spirochaetia bacterium]